ncbi:hypothetical protein BKA67DRAFT_660772 [Truncatella angustata]|uniref:Uncharacterized protein n=1 Tax=Truncatella angustata TaxID=152316 RepID=A0A9P8UGY6_9PEZI|nr:uncharacterized protein BKA67DRAFT_660772 [Truncatella angustata]KAH6652000.1 hypothetical protein BKA67DRAFT_660772 [Truncatella angustata]KAH8205721.1 hypothetical protein TruAng_000215 [Truncatella angustata]
MSDPFVSARPPTPQVLIHRLPEKADDEEIPSKPSKYIILIMGSTGVAGKTQIANTVSKALACPTFQGDSLHASSAKAAEVGTSKDSGPNEGRYQRMWLSKLTRTGLLFPEESRAATDVFAGFGRSSSTTTSRRGSSSSLDSTGSSALESTKSSVMSSSVSSGPPRSTQFIHKPVTTSEVERQRQENPALLVLTHPPLKSWHKQTIRNAVGEYGIGVIFVPLDDDGEIPVLKPLDPRTMSSFGSFGAFGATQNRKGGSLNEEMLLRVDLDANVEGMIEEIIDGVKDMMGTSE